MLRREPGSGTPLKREFCTSKKTALGCTATSRRRVNRTCLTLPFPTAVTRAKELRARSHRASGAATPSPCLRPPDVFCGLRQPEDRHVGVDRLEVAALYDVGLVEDPHAPVSPDGPVEPLPGRHVGIVWITGELL